MLKDVAAATNNQWWRWFFVPVAALAGGIVGSYALGVVAWLGAKMHGGYSEDGWWFRYILPVLMSATFGWLYGLIACAVAPRGKIYAGIVMTTLLIIVGIVTVSLSWIMPRVPTGIAIQVTVGTLASTLCAIFAIVKAHSEQPSPNAA
jgi:hypothetical protein